jgi:glycerate 2-kinase
MEGDLRQILDAGLATADPKDAVLRSLELDGDSILAGGESFEADRVFVLSAGKAACAMARAAVQLLGDRISGGLVVTKEGHEAPLESLEILAVRVSSKQGRFDVRRGQEGPE